MNRPDPKRLEILFERQIRDRNTRRLRQKNEIQKQHQCRRDHGYGSDSC